MAGLRHRLLGMLAVLVAASMWGTLGLFGKMLYAEGVSVEALVAFRAFVAWVAVVCFVALARRPGSLRVVGRDLALLVPMGVFGVGSFYFFFFYTVQEGPIGTAAILLYSAPAFVVVLARIFLHEELGPLQILALLLTVGGIFLVAGAYDPANLEVRPVVVLSGLVAGLSYGMYSIFGRPLAGRLDLAVILFYALGAGSLVLVLAALPTLHTLLGLSAGAYLILFMLAFVHSALGYVLYTFGLRRLEAGQAAILATVEPVVASVLGVVLLNEAMTALKLLGGVLVLAGAALAQIRLRKTHLGSPAATRRLR